MGAQPFSHPSSSPTRVGTSPFNPSSRWVPGRFTSSGETSASTGRFVKCGMAPPETGAGRIQVGWRDGREHGAFRQVWYASSRDGGVSFSANRRISDEPAGTGAATRGQAFLSDGQGTLYLVWAGVRGGTPPA